MSPTTKVEFRKLLQTRIRNLREEQNYSRKDMARMLDVPEDTYKKWEISPSGTMPSFYHVKFCTIVKASLRNFLSTDPMVCLEDIVERRILPKRKDVLVHSQQHRNLTRPLRV